MTAATGYRSLGELLAQASASDHLADLALARRDPDARAGHLRDAADWRTRAEHHRPMSRVIREQVTAYNAAHADDGEPWQDDVDAASDRCRPGTVLAAATILGAAMWTLVGYGVWAVLR